MAETEAELLGINLKWLAWAADLLELASEKFTNYGCNDIEWPSDWSEADKIEFTRAVAVQNGDEPDSEEPGRYYCDWLAMSFLADRLRDMVERGNQAWLIEHTPGNCRATGTRGRTCAGLSGPSAGNGSAALSPPWPRPDPAW